MKQRIIDTIVRLLLILDPDLQAHLNALITASAKKALQVNAAVACRVAQDRASSLALEAHRVGQELVAQAAGAALRQQRASRMIAPLVTPEGAAGLVQAALATAIPQGSAPHQVELPNTDRPAPRV